MGDRAGSIPVIRIFKGRLLPGSNLPFFIHHMYIGSKLSILSLCHLYNNIKKQHNPVIIELCCFFHERAGIRTPDNLIKSQVLYHLSYTPVMTGLVGFEPTNAGVKVLCLTAWR